MPTTKQKYVLSHRHQLIDLNKTFKNFKLQFQVVATEPNTDFHAIVLNQEQLDGTTDLQNVEMKLAKGRIGGTIVADNDKYQNYFLVLKSIHAQDNTEVELTTTLEEVEPKAAPPLSEEQVKETYTAAPPPETVEPTTTTAKHWVQKPWLWILVLALVLGGAYYYFYIYNKGSPVLPLQDQTETPPFPATTIAACTVEPPVDMVLDTDVAPVAQVLQTAAPPRASSKRSSKQTLYNKLAEIA